MIKNLAFFYHYSILIRFCSISFNSTLRCAGARAKWFRVHPIFYFDLFYLKLIYCVCVPSHSNDPINEISALSRECTRASRVLFCDVVVVVVVVTRQIHLSFVHYCALI